jgi:hypothetical protein
MAITSSDMVVAMAREFASWTAKSRTAIAFLGIAMTSVQAFDGVIGALAHDPSKTYGPFVFAILNALAVGWLLRGQKGDPKKP